MAVWQKFDLFNNDIDYEEISKMMQSEFKKRRAALFSALPTNSIAILPAAPELWRSADAYHDFYQDNDFYYLTGFPETEAVAVFIKEQSEHRYILFNRAHDPEIEQWVGHFAGNDGAIKEYGADESYPITELEPRLKKLMLNKEVLYCTLGRYDFFDKQIKDALNALRTSVRAGTKVPDTICNLENLVFEMRLIKTDAEVELMRKAADVSVGAHKRILTSCKPGMNEYELEAELVYEFMRHGCSSYAYKSIVAGGANACVLHYIENNQELKDGDLILVDAGGRYQSYCADITRTFPVNGKYTPEQKALYDIVLKAQLEAIEQVKPGNRWNEMNDIAIRVITQGLVDEGILKGQVDELVETKAYKPFYWHLIGHWLGMDVHDVGRYKENGEWRKFQSGMVTTVEPGIYVKPGTPNVDEKWWGIGIRIEDNVLVTDAGRDVLTDALPKTTDDVEALMA